MAKKKVYSDDEAPADAACYDCGLPYGIGPFGDISLPHDIWEQISPSPHRGCGLLCPNCIMRRLSEAGLGGITATLFPAEP